MGARHRICHLFALWAFVAALAAAPGAVWVGWFGETSAWTALANVVDAKARAEPTGSVRPQPARTADDQLGSEPRGVLDCSGLITWGQSPDNNTAVISQNDVCLPFRAEVADDFMGDGRSVVGVGWWGEYWDAAPTAPNAFEVNIYVTDPDGCPGALVFTETLTDYHESVGTPYGYCVEFGAPFEALRGVRYSLSIVSDLCHPPAWGWATSVSGNGHEMCFRSEYLGEPDWTPVSDVYGQPWEAAFFVYSEGGSVLPIGKEEIGLWDGMNRTFERDGIVLTSIDWVGVDVVQVYGAAGAAGPDGAHLAAALADFEDTDEPIGLWLAPGDWILLGDTVVPDLVTLVFPAGARLVVPPRTKLTIRGSIHAGLWQIFAVDDPGAVRFGSTPPSVPAAESQRDARVTEVYPEWWHDPTSSDWSLALNAAIRSDRPIRLQARDYAIEEPLVFAPYRGCGDGAQHRPVSDAGFPDSQGGGPYIKPWSSYMEGAGGGESPRTVISSSRRDAILDMRSNEFARGEIRHLGIVGPGSSSSGSFGMDVDGYAVILHDVSVRNCAVGVRMANPNGSSISTCFIADNETGIATGHDANEVTITGCRFERNGVALDLAPYGTEHEILRFTVRDNTFLSNTQNAVRLHQCPATSVSFYRNRFESNTTVSSVHPYEIWIEAGDGHHSVEGLEIVANHFQASADAQNVLRVGSCNSARIANNLMTGSAEEAIDLSVHCRQVRLSNNVADGSAPASIKSAAVPYSMASVGPVYHDPGSGSASEVLGGDLLRWQSFENLLANGSFENGAQPWLASDCILQIEETEGVWHGRRALKILPTVGVPDAYATYVIDSGLMSQLRGRNDPTGSGDSDRALSVGLHVTPEPQSSSEIRVRIYFPGSSVPSIDRTSREEDWLWVTTAVPIDAVSGEIRVYPDTEGLGRFAIIDAVSLNWGRFSVQAPPLRENRGLFVADTPTSTYSIPHGLGTAPLEVTVTAASAGAAVTASGEPISFYVNSDNTNDVTFEVVCEPAPDVAGDIELYWSATLYDYR